MANNTKEVQRKADAKRAGKRARAWVAIGYEESLVEGWLEVLRNMLVECLVSPLHDKDLLPNGEPKKPHWHIVVSFKNPTTYESACEVFNRIGAVVPPEREARVRDFTQMARYICHLDQPEKHRYDPMDVISIGSIDYMQLVMNANDEENMLDEIFDAMDQYYLDSYPKVIRFAKENHPEWRTLIYRKYTRQVSEYAKGLHFENGQITG